MLQAQVNIYMVQLSVTQRSNYAFLSFIILMDFPLHLHILVQLIWHSDCPFYMLRDRRSKFLNN